MRIAATLTLAFALLTAANATARNADERLGDAINREAWLELDSLYATTPHDSISDFIATLTRCMLGSRLNRADGLKAYEKLFADYGSVLTPEMTTGLATLYSLDLQRHGSPERAAAFLDSIIGSLDGRADPGAIETLQAAMQRFRSLSAFKTYQIERPDGRMAFDYIPVGPADKGSLLMHLRDGSINGHPAAITFDTGAGANIICEKLAKTLDLTPLGGDVTVAGLGLRQGSYVIAREMKVGDAVFRNIPFIIIDISSDNAEADQYTDAFRIVVGSELMMKLRHVTIDFENNEISYGRAAGISDTGRRPNMCLSNSLNLLAEGSVMDDRMMMCIDSGDGAFGTLGYRFFTDNKEYIITHGRVETVRSAGVGGISITQCYNVRGMELTLGGNTVSVPSLMVNREDGKMAFGYECNTGLRTLMLFGRVSFDLDRFVLTTLPRKD